MRRIAVALIATLTVTAVGRTGEAAPVALTQSQAKAGFLYNCAMFVGWPAAEMAGRDIVIGVLGDDALSAVVKDLQGQMVNGRVLRVHSLRPIDTVTGHHILFVAGDDSEVAKSVIARVGDAPILTVGEHDDFTASGGVVRLYTEQGRLRFEINMTSAEDAGLKVSAKMLGLAKIVR